MKKSLVIAGILCILGICHLDAGPVWSGGAGVSLEGFDASGVFSHKEHLGIEVFYDPFQFSFLSPSLFAGMHIPFPPQSSDVYVGYAGMRLKLFTLQNHPFSWVSQRNVHLTPSLETSIHTEFDNQLSYFGSVLVEPLVFFFGEYSASILGLRLYYSDDIGIGWGLRLFGFRYFLF